MVAGLAPTRGGAEVNPELCRAMWHLASSLEPLAEDVFTGFYASKLTSGYLLSMQQSLLELQMLLSSCLSSLPWPFALRLADDQQAVSSLAKAANWARALRLLPAPPIVASAVTALEARGTPRAVPFLLERLSQKVEEEMSSWS